MDSQKLGSFITEMRKRKGLTQRELAEQLNLTDKAVSKWERGLGLPDLKMIEPLAQALGVSVLDIMRGECTEQKTVPKDHASRVLSDVIDIVLVERKLIRRNTTIACLAVLAIVSTVFLIDIHGAFGFIMVFLPIIMFPISLILLFSCYHRMRKMLPYKVTLFLGILALLIPATLFLLLLFAPILGGPVPN